MKGIIIGIGEEGRADDAAGPLMVRLVAHRLPEGWTAIEHHGDLDGLVELCAGMDEVIIADAVVSGAAPGTVHHVRLDGGELPRIAAAGSTHGVGLLEAVARARSLGRIRGRVTLVGIEAARAVPGEAMSLAVQVRLPVAAALVLEDARAPEH